MLFEFCFFFVGQSYEVVSNEQNLAIFNGSPFIHIIRLSFDVIAAIINLRY